MRAPSLLLLLPLLIGCPDSPTPAAPPPPRPNQPAPVVSAWNAEPAAVTTDRIPRPIVRLSPRETVVYKANGDPVRGELLSSDGADPIVLKTVHGRVSIPRELVTYVRRPGDPPPPPNLLDVQSRAEAGDTDAMVTLGVLLELGRGVPPDPEAAFRWYRKAARAGDKLGMSRLAWACLRGIGTPVDLDGYRRWILQAAQRGDPFARGCRAHLKGDVFAARAAFAEAAAADDERGCFKLAELLLRGPKFSAMSNIGNGAKARESLEYGARLGSPTCMTELGKLQEPTSPKAAARWYRAAAKQGDPGGLTRLGRLYRQGKGVPRNHRRAVALWRRAAQTGRKEAAEAMVLLGEALERGFGVKRPDYDQAKLWFARAAQHGHPKGAAGLRRLGRRSSR